MSAARTATPAGRQAARRARRTPGAVLIVVLALLLGTTLLAVASFQNATLGERMAGNTRDRQVAFQAAETALRDAETMLRDNSVGPFQPLHESAFNTSCSNALCRSTATSPLWSQLSEADWSSAKTFAFGAASGAAALTGLASAPRYSVEYQGTAQPIEPGKPCVALFLLTVRAAGAAATTNVMLQSVYRLRVGDCHAAI
jgi:type IV pilus assembly protein PilX